MLQQNLHKAWKSLQLARWDATGWVAAWQPQTATSNFPVSPIPYKKHFLPLTTQKLWLSQLLRTSQKITTAVRGVYRIMVTRTALMWNYRPDQNSYCPGTSSGQSQPGVSQELPSSWCLPFSPSLSDISGGKKHHSPGTVCSSLLCFVFFLSSSHNSRCPNQDNPGI